MTMQHSSATRPLLGMMTGIDRVTNLAKSAGIESPLRPYPATYLGSSEITLLEMTLGRKHSGR